jgi:hypothetical protein
MSEENTSGTEEQTVEEETTKPFYHKSGMGNSILRMKDGEELEDAVERLRKAGWIIPDLGQLAIKEDAVGKYFVLK